MPRLPAGVQRELHRPAPAVGQAVDRGAGPLSRRGSVMTASTTRAARAYRGTHTEGRSPEELRELVSHWGAELELAPAEHIIEWAAATFGDRFCVTSSMGDAVLAHL